MEGRGVAGPVDKEEATEDNDGHGEEDSTIEYILMQAESSDHLKKNENKEDDPDEQVQQYLAHISPNHLHLASLHLPHPSNLLQIWLARFTHWLMATNATG